MNVSRHLLCLLACAIGACILAQDSPEVSDQVFDLEELEVLGKSYEMPDLVFRGESPQFTYYSPARLPNGEVILALDFIDRYEAARVPGPAKWAAIVTFPWIDGRDQRYVEWLCLYLWNNRIYGFSPTARYDSQMRFSFPIPVDRKTDPDALYLMAEKFVEAISPAESEPVYWEFINQPEYSFSPTNGELNDPALGIFDPMQGMITTNEVEFLEIPAGRIEGWRPSDKGNEREELVSLIYQFSKDPNPDTGASGSMGPDALYREANSFWKKNFSFDFSADPHPFDIAHELLKPRWSMRAILYYEKDVLFFKDVDHKAEVLLFNVGRPIFAYHPRYGVWRTEATIQMIAQGLGSDLITYPGVEKPMRVKLRLWKDDTGEGN